MESVAENISLIILDTYRDKTPGSMAHQEKAGGYLPGGEAPHDLVVNRHEIAADGPVVGAEFDPLGGSLEWRAAAVISHGIIAQQAKIGHIRASR